MRENLKQFGRSGWRFLAIALTAAPLLTATGWADNYNLDSVDFASNGERINVILHTGSIVPVQKVLVSNNKLILDIDQITASDTVKTNFIQASNISHVILQPLGEHKIRLIVRGENLGAPSVAFFNPTIGAYSLPNPSYNGPKLQETTAGMLNAIQEQGTQPATLSAKPNQDMMEQAAVDHQPLQTEELPAETPMLEAIQPAPTSKSPNSVLAPLTMLNGNNPAGTQNPFFDFKLPRTWETYIPYGLLGLLILGIAGFVTHRILKLKQADASTEEWIDDAPDNKANSGKQRSFREMAAAYRSQKRSQGNENTRKSNYTNEPIGLRGLKHMDSIDAPSGEAPQPKAAQPVAARPENAKTLENILSALQAAQSPKAPPRPAPMAPTKQAVGQYLKNNADKAKAQNYQETLQRELKRAQDIQNQIQRQLKPSPPQQKSMKAGAAKPAATPVNRAPAAQKTTPLNQSRTKQGPLPDNPEVLNFLRNVADLMEKDGKNDLAKSIHKNLNTQKLIP